MIAKSVQPKQLVQSWNKHLTVKHQTKMYSQKFGKLLLIMNTFGKNNQQGEI